MTQHPAAMTASFGTGEILLTAALMAIGMPLDPDCPCELVEKESGSYGRFHLLHQSICGKHQTEDMMRAWSREKALPADHPFAWLMTFIRLRPQGVSSVSDWMAWAIDHCRELGFPAIGLPANIAAIPAFIAAAPESRQAYIFAFVHCRDFALGLFLQKKRVKIMQSRSWQAHALVDTRLPKPQRNEILSRLEGA